MAQITVLRHGESLANVAKYITKQPYHHYDAALTEEGKMQASMVTGHFDLVLCSPMKRARQTLKHSKITYDKLEILHEAREKKRVQSDFMEGENFSKEETPREFLKRVNKLRETLLEYCSEYDKVLLVTHKWVVRFLTSTNKEEIQNGLCMEGNGITLHNCEMRTLDLSCL